MKNYIYLLFSVTLVFLAACAKETGVIECPDGTFCPDGYRCEEKIGEEGSYQCTNAGCGNRIVEPSLNEECDLGDANSNQPNAVCRANCQFRDCGDGILDDIEDCDNGADNTFITGDSTSFEVIDGQINIVGEVNYQNAAPNSCRAITNPNFDPDNPASQPQHLCRLAGCWDGIVDDGEDCDDANDNPNDTCVSCVHATCGDGIKNQSDTTNDGSPILEECDDGIANANDADLCRLNCKLPTCGDNITDSDEECDQGENNANEPNHCRENCELPFCGDNIVDSSSDGSWDPEECDEGANNVDGIENACRADCTIPQCGDGLVDSANPYGTNEQCDDNNTDPNDGCDANCQKEPGWSCINDPNQPSVCSNSCGDGIIVAGEECDDQNTNPGDGCTPSCDVEPGWDCSATGPNGSICVPVCGDSRMVGSETCDDGNTTAGDGCSSSCQVETGYVCTAASPDPYVDPSVCQPDCGDGLVRGDEVCDDGNNSNPNDGCADDCRSVRHGWYCDNSEPSNCHTQCGDNLIAQIEECDNGVDPGTGNPVGGDGCSAGCTIETGWTCSGEPSVCNTVCGDGILIIGHEVCDPPEFGGKTCIDYGFATEGTLLCENDCQTISDASCSSICGNGQVEPGEECDDSNSNPDDGCASCTISNGWYCSGEPSNCTTNCGDSIQAGSEVCDNTDLAGRDCTHYGYSDPSGLGCNASCTSYVTTGCSNSCGDGNKESGEQCDDNNNSSGDGCDATCNIEEGWNCDGGSPTSCTEICGDTLVVGTEACDSGNLNGRTCTYYNYSDPGGLQCNGTCDDFITTNCTNTCPDGHVEPGEQCDDGNLSVGDGCDASCQQEAGWNCSGDPSVCIEVCGDGNIVGAEACDGANLDSKTCTDFGFTDPNTLTCLGDCSNFDLSGCANDCGDGIIEPNEDCDDGNSNNGDGCSNTCTVEPGWDCTGEPSTCEGICGDTLVRGSEACDDGGTTNGDGCNSTCQVETGWICDGSEPSNCTPDCGDGLVRGSETCDDGNTADLDGCNSSCQVEPGWNCNSAEPTVCTSNCGDGIIVTGEDCDDNNIINGDGCNSSCQVESGWNCTGEPSVCDGICGDTFILGTETCDDGNTADLDGCSSSCQVEAGWNCDGGEPTNCDEICGDGLVVGSETCDDGSPLINGDGCDINCQEETGWDCTGQPSTCDGICGDSLIRGTETCDDGNTDSLDGCSDICQEEAGWNCDGGEPTTCDEICGDGLVVGDEECDDFNNNDGDGCDSSCVIENDWQCSGEPSVCDGICGDGKIIGSEECDDDNTNPDDGCSDTCLLEPGWDCTGEPTTCTEICPDGLVVGYEECDDNNSTNGDGCSDACLIEDYWTCDTSEPSICTCTSDLACEENFQCVTGACEEYIGGSCPGFVVDSNYYLDSGDTSANLSNEYNKYDGDKGNGNDVFYQVYLTAGEFLYANVYNTPGWNPVLVLLNSCYTGGDDVDAATLIEYANYNGADEVEQIHFVAAADGTYIIVVDGQESTDNGTYNVEIVHGFASTPDTTSNLIINELLVVSYGSGRHEWIEIYNGDGVDYNLNGATLKTNSDEELIDDDVIILSNSYVVLARYLTSNDLDGNVDVSAWAWGGNDIFDDETDTIQLLDSTSNVIDEFSYDYEFNEHDTANLDPGSKSKTGNDDWANWCPLNTSTNDHTPGYENNTCP